MPDKILWGKQVVYIAPATDVMDVFSMPDDQMVCPHFERLKLASNGCFYRSEWCCLKLTYRAVFPFITVWVQYEKIKEPLTRAGREFIPWFGQSEKGYLFIPSLRHRSETGIYLRNPSKTMGILSSAENFRRVFALTSRMSLAELPGVTRSSSLPNTWVDVSMVFFLSPGLQYSRLFHPDQHQKCKLESTSICPLLADDAQGNLCLLQHFGPIKFCPPII